MNHKLPRPVIAIVVIAVIAALYFGLANLNTDGNGELTASGSIEATPSLTLPMPPWPPRRPNLTKPCRLPFPRRMPNVQKTCGFPHPMNSISLYGSSTNQIKSLPHKQKWMRPKLPLMKQLPTWKKSSPIWAMRSISMPKSASPKHAPLS